MKRQTATFLCLLLSVSLSVGRSESLAQQHGLEGRWEGAIIIVPAEQEIEVTVDLARSQSGQISGQVYFPMTGPQPLALENFALQKSRLSFQVRDEDGIATSFEGALRDDATIAGTMTERGKALPFSLHRQAAPPPHARTGIGDILEGTALPSVFDRDAGRRRILLILSPAHYSSRMTLSLIQRYVLDTNPDPNVRLYVLWEVPPDVPAAEVEKVIKKIGVLSSDARTTHFWSPDRTLRNSLQPYLEPYGAKSIANPCLLFSGEKKWGTPPPIPDHVRVGPQSGSKAKLSSRDRLNGINFALDVIMRPASVQ